jgi:hypothetical protein
MACATRMADALATQTSTDPTALSIVLQPQTALMRECAVCRARATVTKATTAITVNTSNVPHAQCTARATTLRVSVNAMLITTA